MQRQISTSSTSSITALVPGGVVTTQNISTVIRPKDNNNSMQFVKIQTPELSKKAVEQIRVAQESKISKEKIKEVEEEWQNNLLNWKSKRRQQFVGNHETPNSQDNESQDANDNGSGRKIKTFAEMIEQRAKTGNRLNFHLQRYIGSGDDDDVHEELHDVSADEPDHSTPNQKSCSGDDDNDVSSSLDEHSRSMTPPTNSSPKNLDPITPAPEIQLTNAGLVQHSTPPIKESKIVPIQSVKTPPSPPLPTNNNNDVNTHNPPLPKLPQRSVFEQTPPQLDHPPLKQRQLQPLQQQQSKPQLQPKPILHPKPKPSPQLQLHLKPLMQQQQQPKPDPPSPPQPQPIQKQQSSPRLQQSNIRIQQTSSQTQIEQYTDLAPQLQQKLSINSPKLEHQQPQQPSPQAPPPIPFQQQPKPPQPLQPQPQLQHQPINQQQQPNPKPQRRTPPQQPISQAQTQPQIQHPPPPQTQHPPPPQIPPQPQPQPQLQPELKPKLETQQPQPKAKIEPELQSESAAPRSHQSQQIQQQTTVTKNSQRTTKTSPREDKDRTVLSVSGKKRCSSCREELGRGAAAFVVESLSLVYHTNCFRCSVCHVNLSNGFRGVDVRVHAGALHCQNCYSKDGLKYSRV